MFQGFAHQIEGHPLATLFLVLLAVGATAGAGLVRGRRRAAVQAEAEAAHMRSLADAAIEGLLILDEGLAVGANRAFLRMTGFLGDTLPPCAAADFFPGLDLAGLTTDVGAPPVEALLANSRGRDRLVELRLRAVTWNGRDCHALAVSDITETRENISRMSDLAYRDPLTRLPNRTRFNEELCRALDRVREGERIAVLVAHLDGFHAINASHGATVGDSLLLRAGRLIRRVTRKGDLAARLDGDMFGLIQYGGTEPAHAGLLAGRIQHILSRRLRAGPTTVRLGCSIGIAFYPDDGRDPAELVRRAGQALAYARAAGGTVRVYEPQMDQAARQRRQLALDLRQAIARGRLGLHFQPIAEAGSGRIAGFEALCRWQHPKLGAVSPAIFVPLAEEIGLMPALGEWVLRQACAEAALWAMPVPVSVNLSPTQFADGDLAAIVAGILAETGLDPARLDLEVTETILAGDKARALATLHRLRGLGVSVSLDDFGTGATSLNSLRLFAFDRLKIDPCFTRDIATCADARAIVRAVIGMGRARGMIIVAEGVEDEARLAALRDEGCDLVQGYAVSRPGVGGSFILAPAAAPAPARELEAA